MSNRRFDLANLNLAAPLTFTPTTRTWYSDEFRRLGAIAHFDPSLGATDNGTTSTWVDRIGGNTVTSTSQATRLVYSASLANLNGRPGWTGVAASNTKLVNTASTALGVLMAGVLPHTIYTVRRGIEPTSSIYFSSSKSGSTDYLYCGSLTGVHYSAYVRQAGGQTAHTGAYRHTIEGIVAVMTFTGTTGAVHDNGGVAITPAADSKNLDINNLCIGGLIQGTSVSFCFDGEIGDIIVFPTAHTNAQRMYVERLLAQKYGWPCIRGVSGFSTANYLSNAGLTSGIRGDNTNGVWTDALIRPDAVPSGTQYIESAWAGVAGQSIVSSGAALGFTAGNATANATSPTRTIAVTDVGKLMIFGGAAGPADLARGFVNGAEISAGTALAGYAKDTATAFSAGARAAVSPATNYSIFGIAGGDSAQVAANHAARAAAIKAAGRFVFTGGVAATHGWRFETPDAYHADAVGVDMLTRTGTLTETQAIVSVWPW